MSDLKAWLALLKPAGNSFARPRMLLGALAFGLPMGWLIAHHQLQAAGFAGFGIIVSLFMDIGATRKLRLESMLIGNTLILLAASLSLALNEHWLLWFAGIVLIVSLAGSHLAGGFALDLKLRMMGGAYLIGYPGSQISSAILPMYLLGALLTIAISAAFAPRSNNPVALPEPPHWRSDWLRIRQGQRAGLTFGIFLALACGFSLLVAETLKLYAPYIAAITTLMVFRPEPNRTTSTIWLRVAGVLLASVLAWFLIFPVNSSWILLALAIVSGSLFPVAFANGLLYVAALVTFIVYIILALMGLHGHAAQLTAEARLIETLLGAMVAALFATIYQHLTAQSEPPLR
ncbi:FUSC family protein [Chitinibacter sp. S2-10]|uniref:FUSC family protein n=1 Tax=Chitinibacter sp. S2-10 TaxID=3373597 RepID=UPI003977B1D4